MSRVYDCLMKIGEVITENKDFLTDLDREIGDADHGVNMARGFHAVSEKVPADMEDIGAALKKAGMTLLSTVGGASGPLYGTAYMEAGKAVAGKTTLAPEDLKVMLEVAIAGIQKRGHAVKGEKTMLDALMPAHDAYCEAVAAGADIVAARRAGVRLGKVGPGRFHLLNGLDRRRDILLGQIGLRERGERGEHRHGLVIAEFSAQIAFRRFCDMPAQLFPGRPVQPLGVPDAGKIDRLGSVVTLQIEAGGEADQRVRQERPQQQDQQEQRYESDPLSPSHGSSFSS